MTPLPISAGIIFDWDTQCFVNKEGIRISTDFINALSQERMDKFLEWELRKASANLAMKDNLTLILLKDGTRVHFADGRLFFRRIPEDGMLVFPSDLYESELTIATGNADLETPTTKRQS
jgi:hypothetical protein